MAGLDDSPLIEFRPDSEVPNTFVFFANVCAFAPTHQFGLRVGWR